MKSLSRVGAALSAMLCAACVFDPARAADAPAPEPQEIVRIWSGAPPGTADWSGPETAAETQVPGAGRAVYIIKNVKDPTLTVIRPAAGRATGAGMIVLPGGGFGGLAWDLEGSEVGRWLAERGVTAFVLKYRVHDADPATMARISQIFAKRGPNVFDEAMNLLDARRRIAVQDAMQAVRVVRSDAHKYGVSPDRIGMMGFSAGAITTMGALTESDAAARPNFAAPIYGAMMADAPPKDGPPLFIAAAQNDDTVPVRKSVDIFEAWQKAGLGAELHIYETGGHGFGLGKPGTTTTEWPRDFETWLVAHKLATAP